MKYVKNKKECDKTLKRIYDLLESDDLKNDLKKVINSLRDNKYKEQDTILIDENIKNEFNVEEYDKQRIKDLSSLLLKYKKYLKHCFVYEEEDIEIDILVIESKINELNILIDEIKNKSKVN